MFRFVEIERTRIKYGVPVLHLHSRIKVRATELVRRQNRSFDVVVGCFALAAVGLHICCGLEDLLDATSILITVVCPTYLRKLR